MKIFDEYIAKVWSLLEAELCTNDAVCELTPWPLAEKTPFIMERDTALELGGYPKDSINMTLFTASDLPFRDLQIIGSGLTKEHISFGKVVLLKVKDEGDFDPYEFQQELQMAELRFRPKDVMQRTSGEQFLTNYRVSKTAISEGFTLEKMGAALLEHFGKLPYVEEAAAVLVTGDSSLYSDLRPLAEDVKKISIALNNKFDGIDMDCGSCSMSPICDEVEELRELHRKSF